jgi:hypothetical protein
MRLVSLLIVVCLVGCSVTPTPPAPRQELHKAERRIPVTPEMQRHAAEHVEQLVKSSLIAPATAIVHPPTMILASVNERDGSKRLWALGAVDSQNLYGAMLRTDYVCLWGLDADNRPGRRGITVAQMADFQKVDSVPAPGNL